ncbi:CoA transferase [Acetobacter persici]|uniref:CaiB/BaiF CoA transferase family protein n=1 Tax=Acetobacter persici TaxID=1076596 RepID=UPI0020CC9AE2|nr:CoA transferase [Acetobacter persici]MCP9319590.1 CoA transferase [Acetobacter persici]
MTAASSPCLPLQGVKVLDLSRVLAGPLCAAMLADLGADVTKIERPDGGDDSRAFGPYLNGESTYFMLLNRGKKSITLDLKKEDGMAIFLKLVKQADVLVENFRPGVTTRLGIDYASLNAINPRLIYVSISGFGQEGPLAQRAAYDHVIQAIGGIMSTTGWPSTGPTRVSDPITDVVSGLYGAWGALAGILQRQISGNGTHIDVAMLDAVISLQVVSLAQLMGGAASPGLLGNAHAISAPMDTFPTTDGEIVIAVANDSLFTRLAKAIGQPELDQDPRFSSDPQRHQNQDALKTILSAWSSTLSMQEAMNMLVTAGVPAAPVNTLADALQSPHVHERGLVKQVEHPVAGPIQIIPQPVRFNGLNPAPELAAPVLGAHTDTILHDDLELSHAQIAQLRADNVL